MRLQRQGFTLMELMIVLIIVAVLAGLGLGIVTYVQEQMRRTGTKVLIDSLDSACKTYKSKYGRFPANGASFQDTDSLLRSLGGPSWNNGANDQTEYVEVNETNSIDETPKRHFQDLWEAKLYYSNNMNNPPAGYAITKRKNRTGVDIWSGAVNDEDAANGLDDSSSQNQGSGTYGDDVTNWN